MKIPASFILILFFGVCLSAQTLEPARQAFIEQQAARLLDADAETRRDAVLQLRLQANAVAARAAVPALNDKAESVRAAAASAVAFLADEDAAAALTPFLQTAAKPKNYPEKSEFVRREAAFALGAALSKTSVPALINSLEFDAALSVRAAAAIALGKIADERAIPALSNALLAPLPKKKDSFTEDEFVRRSAARALGEIRYNSAVPALIAALQNEANAADIRREAAAALGVIADKSAESVLRANLNAEDYLLAEIAAESLRRIENSQIVAE